MPSINGYDIWIEVDGVRRTEYKVEVDAGAKNVSCWIPCEAGKEFSIGASVPPDLHRTLHHSLKITMDGKRVDGVSSILWKYDNQRSSSPTFTISKAYADAYSNSKCTFKFGTIQLTDEDDYLGQTPQAFGEMTITLYSVVQYMPGQRDPIHRAGYGNAFEEKKMHERAKKGLSHCVAFGQIEADNKPATYVTPVGMKRVFTVLFKYRSMDILVADGIAPRNTGSPAAAIPLEPGNSQDTKPTVKTENDKKRPCPSISNKVIDLTGSEYDEREPFPTKKRKGDGSGSSTKRVKQETTDLIDLTI